MVPRAGIRPGHHHDLESTRARGRGPGLHRDRRRGPRRPGGADLGPAALNSRVVIEQAKGVIAERRQVDMDQSFALLRGTARTSNRRLSELARAVVDGTDTI